MRTTMFGLALLGAAVSAPALAQTSPAAPDRNPPAAATQNSTNPATPAPAPNDRAVGTTDRANTAAGQATDRSGATTVGPSTEGGQSAVRIDDGTRTAATPQPGAGIAALVVVLGVALIAADPQLDALQKMAGYKGKQSFFGEIQGYLENLRDSLIPLAIPLGAIGLALIVGLHIA